MKKIIRETERLYSKITDYFFLTQNFHKYQKKYSGSYSNSYKLKKNQICLIHTPKTAGTSLNEHLKRNKIFIHESAHCLVSKYCEPKDYKYIIIIRNPINRIKSFFEMQLNNKKLAFHQHAKKGLIYFIEKLKINQNCLCKFILGDLETNLNKENYLLAEKRLSKFWFVIDFNNLDKEVKNLSKKLNILPEMDHHGKKQESNKHVLTNTEIEVIKKYNKYDLKIYDHYIKELKR